MLEIVGYPDRISARAGETIAFKVSCGPERYSADIVRIINGDTNPNGPGFKTEAVATPIRGDYPGRRQATYAGSYVLVPDHAALSALKSWQADAIIWPTTPGKGEQAIIGKWSKDAGVLLMIDEGGALALCLGDGRGGREMISSGKALIAREWYRVAAGFDAERGVATLAQQPLASYPMVDHQAEIVTSVAFVPQLDNDAPLLLAARFDGHDGERLITGAHYNGKIEAPRIATRPEADVQPSDLVAAWDFTREISTTKAVDLSPNQLHGETVNMPARAMKGHNWTGRELCWQRAPEQYGAIHFHDDDLYDAGWATDFELMVPNDLRSGFYAAHLQAGDAEDYVPFFVVPPRGQTGTPLALLVLTASYMAYANDHSMLYSSDAELGMGRIIVLNPQDVFLGQHPELGRSLYDVHPDGSGVCHSSRLRPILNMLPGYQSFQGGLGSGLWQ